MGIIRLLADDGITLDLDVDITAPVPGGDLHVVVENRGRGLTLRFTLPADSARATRDALTAALNDEHQL